MRRPPAGPKTRQLALARLRHALAEQTSEDSLVAELEQAVPDAWAMLEADVPCREKKTKVTLYLDASVARFFRAMGEGYQARINRLLTLYAQAKIAESRWFEEAWQRELGAAAADRKTERDADAGRDTGGATGRDTGQDTGRDTG